MSRLYLLRHGQAAWISPDEQRPLTEQGVSQTLAMLDLYAERIESPLSLWVSPYLRAQQSAELVRQRLIPAVEVLSTEDRDCLTPDCDPQRLLAELQRWSGARDLMLVGHNPLLTRLLNLLLGEPAGRYHLGTSALVALELPVVAAGCAELLWLHSGH